MINGEGNLRRQYPDLDEKQYQPAGIDLTLGKVSEFQYNQGTTYGLLKEINDLMTKNGWAVLDSATTTFNGQTVPCYYIWQGSGDGNDKIYLQMKIYDDDPKKITLDSLAGFDKNLYYFEQPGSIQQWLKATDEIRVDNTI